MEAELKICRGQFGLKFELTEFLLNYGRHIGYAIRPSDRNRGLATQMLKQGLKLSKGYGFDVMLMFLEIDIIRYLCCSICPFSIVS